MVAALMRVTLGLVAALVALVVAAPTGVELLSPFFMPAITNMDCGDDVEEDECEVRAEVCSGIFPEPNANPSNFSKSITEEFQACLIAYRPLKPPAQPIIPSMLNKPVIPLPMPDMVPFRFCALNVSGLLNPDLTVNHTAITTMLKTFLPPDVSSDVVLSAVSVCPSPLLHSLTAFMHCLHSACLVLTTSDMKPPSPTPVLVLSPYLGAP